VTWSKAKSRFTSDGLRVQNSPMLMWAETTHRVDAEIGIDDRRRCERISLRCPVGISPASDSCSRSRTALSGQVLDMSSSGVLIHARQQMSIDSEVRIRGNELLTGPARVRHCSQRGFGYRIGLEFATALPDRF